MATHVAILIPNEHTHAALSFKKRRLSRIGKATQLIAFRLKRKTVNQQLEAIGKVRKISSRKELLNFYKLVVFNDTRITALEIYLQLLLKRPALG